ncbi:MAG: sensor histidine kinase [Anaerolineae bacterium]
MMIFDLQWVLFVLLCAVAIVGIGVGILLRSQLRWYKDITVSPVSSDARAPSGALFEQAPFGVLLLEGDQIQYLNAAAQDMLHLATDAERLPPADWVDLLREDVISARDEAADTESGDADAGRYRNVTFASGRTARWWIKPVGARDLVVLLDISAQQRARRTSRSLLSDLGHELRTPIATLLTHLEILGLEDVGADVHRQSLQLSKREAQRLSRLVNDMLELGRLELSDGLMRRRVDLLALVEEVIVQTTPTARERGVSLEVAATVSHFQALGDPDRLRQVLLNLVDNAVKYAGEGARVTVSLRSADGGIKCAVCDNGPGIASRHLPLVTQRFYRAAPGGVEGSGLGLAIVQEILRHHDAALELVSPVADGRGTCAQFTLPAAVAGVET